METVWKMSVKYMKNRKCREWKTRSMQNVEKEEYEKYYMRTGNYREWKTWRMKIVK